MTIDHREAVQAFIEKRKAVFKGKLRPPTLQGGQGGG